MAVPSLDGLIWRSQWNASGEGPYTILAKTIHANSIKLSYFKKIFYWKYPKGSCLLYPNIRSCSNGPLASIIENASLHRMSPRYYGELADGRALRYCRMCISTGFQAAIAQIDALDRCPIHNEPHLSNCVQCGEKTPPYNLGHNNELPRLSCWKCGASYGHGGPIENRFDVWAPPFDLHRLDPIHQLLSKINDGSSISWPSLSGWRTTQLLEVDCDVHRRQAVFTLLSQIVSDRSVLQFKSTPNIEIFGPIPVSNVRPIMWIRHPCYEVPLPWAGNSDANPSMYRNQLRTTSFGVPVPVSPDVPPIIHAQLIWYAQFSMLGADSDRESTNSIIVYPYQIDKILGHHPFFEIIALIEAPVIQGVIDLAWLVANRIAVEWNRLLAGFQSEDSWLSSCNRWQHLLGCWSDYDIFPIAAIGVGDLLSDDKHIHLAVA
jgi:hypothetical protein